MALPKYAPAQCPNQAGNLRYLNAFLCQNTEKEFVISSYHASFEYNFLHHSNKHNDVNTQHNPNRNQNPSIKEES